MPTYIRWPNDIEQAFHSRSGFPGVIGAGDGCHTQTRQPPGNANDNYYRKGNHFIVFQGRCDHTGKFIDVLIRAPGRVHDARVWRHSLPYQKLMNAQNPLLPADKHLLGDSGYLLHGHLLAPFRYNDMLSPEHINYNIKHASTRSLIERAFGRLKNKFRRLYYLDVQSILMATLNVEASCVLHSFILIYEGIRCDSTLSNRNSSLPLDDLHNYLDNEDDDEVSIDAIQKRLRIMDSLG